MTTTRRWSRRHDSRALPIVPQCHSAFAELHTLFWTSKMASLACASRVTRYRNCVRLTCRVVSGTLATACKHRYSGILLSTQPGTILLCVGVRVHVQCTFAGCVTGGFSFHPFISVVVPYR